MAFTEFAADDSLVHDYEKAAQDVFPLLLTAKTDFLMSQYATTFANLLGNPGEFYQYVTGSHGEREAKVDKLLESFSHNLGLLVHKTWCSPEAVKEKDRVMASSAAFIKAMRAGSHSKARTAFLDLVERLDALIFGDIAASPDFIEWAFRIDPKLGLFSWLVKQIDSTQPPADGEETLLRTELLMGAYFLASM